MSGCGTHDGSEIYEGPGPVPGRKEKKSMTKTTNDQTGRGFERWRERQAKEADNGLDAQYRRYLDGALGRSAQERAGIPTSGLDVPGMVDLSEDSDDDEYRRYLDALDGSADRRRASAMAVQHAADADEKFLQDARLLGHPLPAHLEDRRGELREHGY